MLTTSHQPASWPRIWAAEATDELQTRLRTLPFYRAPRVPTLGATQFGASYADISSLIANAPGMIDKIVAIATTAGPYLDTIQNIANDPALPRFVERIKTVRALPSKSSTPGSAGGAVAPQQPGVGLDSFIAPLDWYIWIRQNPAKSWAIGIGGVLAFAGLGFTTGYLVKRRSCKRVGALGRRRRRR